MSADCHISRKDFVLTALLSAASAALPASAGALQESQAADTITLEDLRAVEKLADISFSDEERKRVLSSVQSLRRGYARIRELPIDFTTEPRTVFTPLGGGSLPGSRVATRARSSRVSITDLSDEQVAFLSIPDLAHLLRTKQISPVELTELYLGRIRRYGDKLLCIVTVTDELAMKQARQAEREISAGRYRGPLHGIPYGLKDLFSVKGHPTTWGANTFEDQSFDIDATVARKLEEAGAILLAKTSLGTFAMGDLWHRGRTKNPWNPAEGSSGSSAGSASAVAAGLIGFGIGTETFGSIVSPSHRCRVTGLRPTYGRVSRYGGMALSYTLDKVGPICREAEDCALVLGAICGADPLDPSAVDRPFSWPPRVDLKRMKVGYLTSDVADRSAEESDEALKILKKLGVKLQPVKVSPIPQGITVILGVETGSAFDAFTRGELIRQLRDSAWPETFRQARYVPAVEYLQAQRARTLYMHQLEKDFADFDAIIAKGIGESLIYTNYTGHPQILIPFGVDERGNSVSRSFIGRNYHEDKLVALAKAFQDETDFHLKHPDMAKI